MADVGDVLTALVSQIGAALYPTSPATATTPSAAGPVVRVMRGTPFADLLDADMRQPSPYVAVVTVNERRGFGRNKTRFQQDWAPLSITPATMALEVSGNTVTVGGTPGVGQVAVVSVSGQPYAYPCVAGDTTTSVAAALAAMISEVVTATASGSVLTVPSVPSLTAAVSTQGTSIWTTRQIEIGIEVRVYAPNFALRDTVASFIDAALSSVIRLPLADSSVAMLKWSGNVYDDKPQKALTFLRMLYYTAEFATTQTRTDTTVGAYQAVIGDAFAGSTFAAVIQTAPATVTPLIGAIRFDGWYNATAGGDAQTVANAAALSPLAYNTRLPWFATVTSGAASWTAATQATLDAEIQIAVIAGLNYWAFDSYEPTDPETAALTLYLSSAIRAQMKFCMLGQLSNWSLSGGAPYSAAAQRDITMFAQAGYVTVLGGRPLYYVLSSGTNAQMTAAVAWIRSQSLAQGTGNPYVVLLSGAGFYAYNNVTVAQAIGADAAGAYECPPYLTNAQQPYSALTAGAQLDWASRSVAGLPMVPCAMTDFDPSPYVLDPPPGYTIPAGWTAGHFFAQGTPAQVGAHVASMVSFITANPLACPAGVGLVYAWNELGEGGKCLMPTYQIGNPYGDLSRAIALGQALAPA